MFLTRLRSRLRRSGNERGFTMLLALFVLVITTLLLGAAYFAVLNDSQLSRNDLDQARALAAAQAGIAQYSYDLNANPNYWQGVSGQACPAPSGTVGSVSSGSTERYVDAPLAATGQSACSTANPVATMIEASGPAAGTFRISSTGTSNNVSRTIVAQYKRTSFLDYVYYTDYETLDPTAVPGSPGDCEAHWPNRGADCGPPIDFLPGDSINGPMHTEDTAAICGTGTYAAGAAPPSAGPVFGRTSADTIAMAGLSTENSYPSGTSGLTEQLNSSQSNCKLSYDMVGTLVTNSPPLLPPPSNAQLLNVAQAGGSVYTGTTTIVLNGTTMSVTNDITGVTTSNVALPANGVIYVQTALSPVCTEQYTPYTANATYLNTNPNQTSCGNLYISGYYSSSLTIATDNDIIIDGNLYPTGTNISSQPPPAPTGSALLGLVADNFVRIEHGVTSGRGAAQYSCGSGNGVSNVASQSFSNIDVYAAILSVAHSFSVDNWDCGSALGQIYLWGALAQLYRGFVGSSGSGGTGYLKNYNYDNRLQYAEPPYFLNPVSTAWSVRRQTECDGTASC
jgi:type II secretory pathway pseudopilin PulG